MEAEHGITLRGATKNQNTQSNSGAAWRLPSAPFHSFPLRHAGSALAVLPKNCHFGRVRTALASGGNLPRVGPAEPPDHLGHAVRGYGERLGTRPYTSSADHPPRRGRGHVQRSERRPLYREPWFSRR